MNKSASISTPLPAISNPLYPVRLILILTGIIACLLPWVINPGISLTLSAYDLAEWTSLTPMARNAMPVLLPVLLLRLPLSLTALLLALALKHHKGTGIFIILVAVVAMLPPFEFLHAIDDPNYRQQFFLALLTLLGGLILVMKSNNRLTRWIEMFVAIIIIAAGLWGLNQAYTFMVQYGLPVRFGLGGFLLTIALIALIIHDFTVQIKTRRPTN